MKKGLTLFLILVFAMESAWAQQTLPITKVLLYKNGMAYIVRSGQLNAPLSLSFHPEEMNDVLKTFSAWNPNSGALYSVGYTTGIPAAHTLGRFPFDLSNPDMGLGAFLVQVKGAQIHLELSGRVLDGKLVAVQMADHVVSSQTSTSDHKLTVLTSDGSLQTVWLGDVRTVQFPDPQLREQLRSYLDVLAEGRQDVTREVSVYPVPSAGPIQIAYLQQFPLWKTSYRIDLSERDARVQGWAQIDNPTGESWENVEVSLLSGSPVSFIMNLYEPLYSHRSTVEVPGGEVAAPRDYEAALKTEPSRDYAAAPPAPPAAARSRALSGVMGGVLSAEQADRQIAPGVGQGQGAGVGSGTGPFMTQPNAATFQEAGSTELHDFFEYKFPFAVRLASRQSALLPFLQKSINIERMSIFNPRTDRGNPLNGARVENNTGVPLEPGPVTFFEQGRYAGEAVLDYLSRGEKRLISYGVDHDIQIASKQQNQPETSSRLTVSRGVAVFFRESTQSTTYQIRNKGTQSKILIVEHPRLNDRVLKNAQPWESTEGFHRFRVPLAPGQESELPVTEVLSRQSTVMLQNMSRSQLVLFSGQETPAAIREKIGQLVDLQERIAGLRVEAQTTQGKVDVLFQDQVRLRENLKALQDSREDRDLRTRYIGQLGKQEDEIATLRSHIDSVNKDAAEAQSRLGELISNLSWQG